MHNQTKSNLVLSSVMMLNLLMSEIISTSQVQGCAKSGRIFVTPMLKDADVGSSQKKLITNWRSKAKIFS
jgi:hypothetical protein